MKRITAIGALVAVLGLGAAGPAAGQGRQELVGKLTGPEIIEKLREGGYVILIRHMETERTPEQRSGVDLAKCATQRVLSARGREQANELGRAMRTRGILVGNIVSSPYCRCVQTAELAFGELTLIRTSETLSVMDGLSASQKTARGAEIRALLDAPPETPGTNTVLITHTGQFLWSLGLDSRPEGLAHVFRPTGGKAVRPTYLGSIRPEEWGRTAGLETSAPADEQLVRKLAQGGYVLLMRHAATEREAERRTGVVIGDCATQRILSAEGRRQAEELGRALAALGIRTSRVLASPYCRGVETAELAFGKSEPIDLLAAWDGLTAGERAVRGERVRQLLNTPPAPGTNSVLVTHAGQLLWSLGLATEPEGLVHVFEPSDLGRAIHVGQIRPAAWGKLAGLEPAAP